MDNAPPTSHPGRPTNPDWKPARQCKATSRATQQRCRRWACPGKEVCIIHGARAGRKSNAERYALAAENSPNLKENFALILEENDAFGNIDLTIAGEVTLLRAMLASLVEDPETDPKLKLDMIRDLTRAVQKERELETARENLVPMLKVRQMLQAAADAFSLHIPASDQLSCFEDLQRALEPFRAMLDSSGGMNVMALPETTEDE